MSPERFLADVAHPNMMAAMGKPDDMRATVNAILTLDALAGLLWAARRAAGGPDMLVHERDDDYREALANISPSYRALRDAAASLKHGELDQPRKKRLARLVSSAGAFRSVANGLGMFQCGDELGGEVIVIEFEPGPGHVRASSVVGDSYRMLKRIVEGQLAHTDEHDRQTFSDDEATP